MADTAVDAPAPTNPYAELAKPDRVWLRRTAAAIRAHMGRSARELVDCGEMLRRARRRLGRTRWQPWLDQEVQIGKRSAYRYMKVSGAFADIPDEALARFTTSALYALVDPSCPAALREFAIEQATEENVSVTAGVVAEWLTAFRDPVPNTKVVIQPDAAPPKPEGSEAFAASNWKILCDLVGDGDSSVHLAQVTDVENGERTVSVTVLAAEGGRRSSTAATLEGALVAVSGVKRVKVCKGQCKCEKPLDQFSKCKTARDGRNKYCLVCERMRVKGYLARKSAAAKAG